MRSSSGYSEILDPFIKSYKELGSNNVGNVDETFSLQKLVVGKGFVPHVLTYGILIDGFCKQKRCSEAKLVLEICITRVRNLATLLILL
ncbi:hypothetical protein DKX38_018875 [Salix brachista]|uniref:Pentatricopeptide repeat-containing protein n=1 Tax=Salix brachista TaxID=2182728 RepID=A0A5N5KP79_9ROSI|nr:hypothetical protein DKX38_018875 [Salix brachista]